MSCAASFTLLVPASDIMDWAPIDKAYFWRHIASTTYFLLVFEIIGARSIRRTLHGYHGFIPIIIPFWTSVATHSLRCIALLAVFQAPAAAVQTLSLLVIAATNAFLPPIISRIPKPSLFYHDILPALTYLRSYEYQALPDEAHIRLVRLEGFLSWRRIRILSYPLEKCPPFDAISYTWDGQGRTSWVIVDGYRLSVTRNARHILNDFTPTFGRRMIWIDSICIKQGEDYDSLKEKEIQVGRMSEIYGRAVRVRIWLSKSSVLESPLPEFSTSKRRKIGDILGAVAGRLMFCSFCPPTLSSRVLERLLSHDYWTRVWVVQEIAFAREVLIHIGSTCFYWESISAFATESWPDCLEKRYGGPPATLSDNPFNNVQLSKPVFRGLQQIALITSIRQDTLNGNYQSLLSLLVLFAKTRASDSRDKVYGMSSLVGGAKDLSDSSSTISADYNLSARKLYLKTACFILSRDIDVRVLMYAGIGWPRTTRGLPSWVPDWTSIPETYLDGFTSSYFKWSGPGHSEVFPLSGNLCKISGGRIIDTISAQTRAIDHDDPSRLWFREICDVVGRQLDHISKADIDLSGKSSRCYRRCPGRWRGAIYRVLVGDSQSYWGEVPECTGVTTFERPDLFSPCDASEKDYQTSDRATPQSRANLEHAYNVWRMLLHPPYQRVELEEKSAEHSQFTAVSRAQTQGRKFAITQTGRMCLVPPGTEVGDALLLFETAIVPYLIRPITHGTRRGKDEITKRYLLVGHCFALGIMGGGHRDCNISWKPNPEGYDPLVCREQDIILL